MVDRITWLGWASVAIGVLFFVTLLAMVIVSLREEESRAAGRAVVLAVLVPLPFVLAGVLTFAYREWVAAVLIGLTALAGLIILLPIRGAAAGDDTPTGRIDERDIMFARARLVPGTERFDIYYNANPDKQASDDRFRAKPGLLRKGAKYYDPLMFSASNATFKTVSSFWAQVEDGASGDGRAVDAMGGAHRVDAAGEKHPEDTAGEEHPVDAARVTRFIKNWTRLIGAVSVGVTELRDYHKYSIIGRTEPWGGPVTLDHRFAIALTVEMNKFMVDRAPFGPTVMESAQQYLSSGAMAVQVANFIRQFGYDARAHIDGNYRVVCPLVARDAGLGEIGRMGILMTPELGPRVRIAVVTTDMPLVVDPPWRDATMIDFCARCKKCAAVCPSKAIPFGDRERIDGALRWQIDQERCYTYWCAVGTDCSRCMKVCPYSHPDNLLHNTVRWGVRRSLLFRELAIVLDDFFYGKLPPPAGVPGWMTAGAGPGAASPGAQAGSPGAQEDQV